MRRRHFLQGASLLALAGLSARWTPTLAADTAAAVPGVDQLARIQGALTLYLGRGEGGLYEDVVAAIRERNPALTLKIRRGPSAALANTLVAEVRMQVRRADLFWAVDAGSLSLVTEAAAIQEIPGDIRELLLPAFRFPRWAAISGRVRTVVYNPDRVDPASLPADIMAYADTDHRVGWAPGYAAFQSFITAMRLLEGEAATRAWLRGVARRASEYAGELGAVLAVSRGEVDIAFANHYYSLRLRQGQPEAPVALHFTRNDAGCLVNASGVAVLGEGPAPMDFIRHLLTREVQGFLAREAFELPLVPGVAPPPGVPALSEIQPPRLDLTRLADLRPTLDLMRDAGVL